MKSKSISMQNLLSVISSISICTTDSNNYHQYEFGGKIQSKTNCWSWTKLESRNPHEPYSNMALVLHASKLVATGPGDVKRRLTATTTAVRTLLWKPLRLSWDFEAKPATALHCGRGRAPLQYIIEPNYKNPPKNEFKNSWKWEVILMPASIWQIL